MIFKRKEHHIFFDFGHRFSKMAHVIKHNKQYQILEFNLKPTPDHLLKNEIPTKPLLFKELVYELLESVSENIHKQCIFHLTAPDAHTILKIIKLPLPLPKNLDQQMIYESEQLSPYPIQDAMMDWASLGQDPFFQNPQSHKQCPILVTIAKKSLVHPYLSCFQELDLSIDVATPGSIGLMNLGLHLLRSETGLKRLMLTHLGETASLIIYLSPETIRFCYHPHGFGEVIHQTNLQCDLQISEGRYFAEHFSQKDLPDIFLSTFSNNLTRFAEDLGETMVRLSGARPRDQIKVLLSGGPSQILHFPKCFERFSELSIHHLTFEEHLTRRHITLSPNVKRDALATFSPYFVGYLEAMGP